MTSKKTTRKALFSSMIALLLCCAMLVGSTFAWFTDSVTSGGNIIKSGTLDVEMLWGDSADNITNDASTGAIFDYKYWEPGYTQTKYVKISNKGDLALRYQLNIIPDELDADTLKLAEVIEVYLVPVAAIADRAAVDSIMAASSCTLLSELLTDTDGAAYGVLLPTSGSQNVTLNDADKAIAQTGSVEYCIILHMQESANNDYQDLAIGGEGFKVELLATQYTYENDSFGNDYDSDSEYLKPWNGEVADNVPAEVDGVITITTAEELASFAKSVNDGTSYLGKTIKLANSIDLNNQPWTPIGACNSSAYFQGTFDGQGNTIYNLNVDKSTDTYQFSTAGLFGWIDAAAATIKNVNVNGATVKGSHWVGVIAGFMTGEISNCSVTNATVVGYNVTGDANGDKIGGLVGYMNSGAGKLDGNTVSNSTVIGYRDVAGLAGAVAVTNTVTNNSVDTVDVYYSADHAAAIVSPKTAVVVDSTNTASNVTVTKTLASNADLDAAITDGETELVLGPGVYIIPDSAQGKTLTIIGSGNTVIATQDDGSYEGCDYSLDGSTVTFKNITINTDSSTYTGYARLNATYENCTINGTYTLYGDSTFTGCTFNVSGDVYNIWTWGAPNATFNGCTFNSDGKAMLLYGTVDTKLTITSCVFNDNGGLTDLKAAIEIGNDYNKSYELIVNNTVVNGYEINDEGISTGTTLWGNKNSMDKDHLNVVVDGVDVY